MRYHETLVARLASKIVLDILPATTVSLMGGLVFTHYGLGRFAEPAAQVAPASAEMMQLLRDEHGVIVSFLNAQLEREKTQLAADDALRHASGDAARASATATVPAQAPAASVAVKPASSRPRVVVAAVVAPASAPLVIAQVQPAESGGAPSPAPQSLVAKTTIGLKDHVVSVTHRVVSTLGVIPNWFGQIGDHIGGTNTKTQPGAGAVAAS